MSFDFDDRAHESPFTPSKPATGVGAMPSSSSAVKSYPAGRGGGHVGGLFDHFAEIDHTRDGGALNDVDSARGIEAEATIMGTRARVTSEKWETILQGLLRDAPREHHDHIIDAFRARAIASGELDHRELGRVIWRVMQRVAPGEWKNDLHYNGTHAKLAQEFNELTRYSCVSVVVDAAPGEMGTMPDPDLVSAWQRSFNDRSHKVYGLDAKRLKVDGRVGEATVEAARMLAEAARHADRPDV